MKTPEQNITDENNEFFTEKSFIAFIKAGDVEGLERLTSLSNEIHSFGINDSNAILLATKYSSKPFGDAADTANKMVNLLKPFYHASSKYYIESLRVATKSLRIFIVETLFIDSSMAVKDEILTTLIVEASKLQFDDNKQYDYIEAFKLLVGLGADIKYELHKLYHAALSYKSFAFINFYVETYPHIVNEYPLTFSRFCADKNSRVDTILTLFNAGAYWNWITDKDWLLILNSQHDYIKNPEEHKQETNLLGYLAETRQANAISTSALEKFLVDNVCGFFKEDSNDVCNLNTIIWMYKSKLITSETLVRVIYNALPENDTGMEMLDFLVYLYRKTNLKTKSIAAMMALRDEDIFPSFCAYCNNIDGDFIFLMKISIGFDIDPMMILDIAPERADLIFSIMTRG